MASATLVAAATFEGLLNASCVCRPAAAEQPPAMTVCAAEVNASLAGAAALIVSACTALDKPVAEAVRVGEPLRVSLK